MEIYWRKLLSRIGIWLAAEILLSLIGLDNLADYSEYVFSDANVEFMSRGIPGLISPNM